jgi:Na+-driven multidrug efflux pump
MRIFSTDSTVIAEGVTYLHIIAFCYLLPAITNGVQGYFRGIGDLKITLISSFVNMFGRIIACFILVYFLKFGISAFPYAYLIGWIGMLIAELPLLIRNIKSGNYIQS